MDSSPSRPRHCVDSKVSSLDLENREQNEAELKRYQAATKADDAEVPVYIWDQRLLPLHKQLERGPVLDTIRGFALRWWRRNTLRDFIKWFKIAHPKVTSGNNIRVRAILKSQIALRDWECGRDCIRRCSGASWWEWDLGS